MQRRLFIAAWIALAATWPSQAMAADTPRSYAVLSLMGDRIDVVSFRMTTGSHLDTNDRMSIPVSDGVFDKVALLAGSEALNQLDAKAKVTLYAPSAPELFANQDRFFDGGKLTLPDEVAIVLRQGGATHLLLITKRRADARMQTKYEKLGSGKVEGLGFYIDRTVRVKRGDTGESGQGFLAPFVYINARIVELATMAVIRQESIEATATFSAAQSDDSSHPWDALSAEQKVNILRGLIEERLSEVVPKLVR